MKRCWVVIKEKNLEIILVKGKDKFQED
jgi:hypothetical protein